MAAHTLLACNKMKNKVYFQIKIKVLCLSVESNFEEKKFILISEKFLILIEGDSTIVVEHFSSKYLEYIIIL